MSNPQKQPVKQMTAVTGSTFSDAQIDQLHDIVVNEPKAHNPVMTEATFRDYFLPVLSGQVDDPERLRVYMQGVAGPNISVNVVDANGTFLFEVPPLYSTDHIKCLPDDKNMFTFGALAENVQLMHHRSRTQAENMLQQGLFKRMLAATTKNYEPTANERKWLAIFTRYNIPLQNPNVLTPDNKNQNESARPNPLNGSDPKSVSGQAQTGHSPDFEVGGEY